MVRVATGLVGVQMGTRLGVHHVADAPASRFSVRYLVLEQPPLRLLSAWILGRLVDAAGELPPGAVRLDERLHADGNKPGFTQLVADPMDVLATAQRLEADPRVEWAEVLVLHTLARQLEPTPCTCTSPATGCAVPSRCGCGDHERSGELFCYVTAPGGCASAASSVYAPGQSWVSCAVPGYPNDTFFHSLWTLRNVGQQGTAGLDVDAVSAWARGYTGAGVTVAVLDDGLDVAHPDLRQNVRVSLGRNWNGLADGSGPGGELDPSPGVNDPHGTAVAGMLAATANNSLGVVGVAPGATIAGFRLIASQITAYDEAEAFLLHNEVVDIKSSSWGPEDGRLLGPHPMVLSSLAQSVSTGRGGRGVVHVFAAGNGGPQDNVNNDGYANSIYTIAVSAVDADGVRAWYAEPECCILVCAPSGGLLTTDASQAGHGYTDTAYTSTFGGTSATAPQVAGVVALMLQANPLLGWRDVQEVLIASATQVDAADLEWLTNQAGYRFSPWYGAGLVHAGRAVERALSWALLPPSRLLAAADPTAGAPAALAAVGGVVRLNFVVHAVARVEHVEVNVDIRHPGAMSSACA